MNCAAALAWVTSSLTASVPHDEPALDTVVSGRFACLGLKRLCHERPSDQDYTDAWAQMKQIAVDHLADRPFGVLSQGEQQKILLARLYGSTNAIDP